MINFSHSSTILSRICRNDLTLLYVVSSGAVQLGAGDPLSWWLPWQEVGHLGGQPGALAPSVSAGPWLLGLPHSMTAGLLEWASAEDQAATPGTLWLCLRSHDAFLQLHWTDRSRHRDPSRFKRGEIASISWRGKVKILKDSRIARAMGNVVAAFGKHDLMHTLVELHRMCSIPSKASLRVHALSTRILSPSSDASPVKRRVTSIISFIHSGRPFCVGLQRFWSLTEVIWAFSYSILKMKQITIFKVLLKIYTV